MESREIAGTEFCCLLVGGVRLWEVSVSGGSTVIKTKIVVKKMVIVPSGEIKKIIN